MLSPEVERSDALDEAQAVLAAARRTARTNGLMSAAALLFSGCALAVSLSLNATAGSSYGVPSALLPERAAAKALQPQAPDPATPQELTSRAMAVAASRSERPRARQDGW